MWQLSFLGMAAVAVLPLAHGFLPSAIKGYPAAHSCLTVRGASAGTQDASSLVGKDRVKRFLEDASFLGPVRFITMNEGAILESVGSFENVHYKDLTKGEYATMSNEDKSFECHINLDQVASIVMVQSKAKSGDHDNYITRFLDTNGKVLLSSMLHKPQGQDYEEDAVEWWGKLRNIFGEKQDIIQ